VALLTGWSRADVQVLLARAAIVIDGNAVSKSHKLVEGSVIEVLEEPAVGAPPNPTRPSRSTSAIPTTMW
jgi:hypothetical protein